MKEVKTADRQADKFGAPNGVVVMVLLDYSGLSEEQRVSLVGLGVDIQSR